MSLKPIGQIQCPNCGAKLDIKTGLRARTFACEYCGSVLEPSGEIVALQDQHDIKEKYRPQSFIKLGMTAKFLGHEYQVVGRIRVEGSDPVETWYWDEWFLMSEQGFPLWLTEDAGSFSLMRVFVPTTFINPYYNLEFPASFQDAKDYILGDVKQTIRPDPNGPLYDAEDFGIARIVFLEGEFTWKAKPSEELIYFDYRKGKKRFSMEISRNEIQLIRGKVLTEKQVRSAFGLPASASESKNTDAKKKKSRKKKGVSGIVVLTGLIISVLLLVLAGWATTTGDLLYKVDANMVISPEAMLTKSQKDLFKPTLKGEPETFEVKDVSSVYKLNLSTTKWSLPSEWDLSVSLWELTPNNKKIRLSVFWTTFWQEYDEGQLERHLSDTFYFRGLKKGRKYFLTFSAEASRSNAQTINSLRPITVTIYKDAWYPYPFAIFGGLGLLIFGFILLKQNN